MHRTPGSSRSSASPFRPGRHQQQRESNASYATPPHSQPQNATQLTRASPNHGLGLSSCDLPSSLALAEITTQPSSASSYQTSDYWTATTPAGQISPLPSTTTGYYPSTYEASFAIRTSQPMYDQSTVLTSGSAMPSFVSHPQDPTLGAYPRSSISYNYPSSDALFSQPSHGLPMPYNSTVGSNVDHDFRSGYPDSGLTGLRASPEHSNDLVYRPRPVQQTIVPREVVSTASHLAETGDHQSERLFKHFREKTERRARSRVASRRGSNDSHSSDRSGGSRRRLTTQENAKYTCQLCGQNFARKWNHKKHMDTHMPERVKPHKCDLCVREFTRQPDLIRHIETVHQTIKRFTCDLCGKAFNRHDTLIRHTEDACSKRSYARGERSSERVPKNLKYEGVSEDSQSDYQYETPSYDDGRRRL